MDADRDRPPYPSGMRLEFRREHVVAAIFGTLGAAEAALLEQGHGAVLPRIALVLLAAVGMGLRRRSPLVFAVAAGFGSAVVAAGAEIDSLALFLFGMYAVAWSGYAGRTILESIGGALLVVVPTIVATLRAVEPGDDPLAALAWAVAFCTASWGIGVALERVARRADRAEVRLVAAEAAADEHLARVVAEERRRIARDLHDVISHSVTLMSVQAGGAARVLATDPAAAHRSLVSIQKAGAEAVEELGRLLTVLREDQESPTFAPHPGLGALGALCATAEEAGLSVRVTERGDLQTLPAGANTAAYRIVQEALTNSRRHGGRCHVDVAVERTACALEITVTNGTGADVVRDAPSTGRGLVGIEERVGLYRGTVEAGRMDDGRWRVRARIPLGAPVEAG